MSLVPLFFFFFVWGTDKKEESLHGIKIDWSCPKCNKRLLNIRYISERNVIFLFIPINSWYIDEIYLQCVSCGHYYPVSEDDRSKFIKLYNQMKDLEKSLPTFPILPSS